MLTAEMTDEIPFTGFTDGRSLHFSAVEFPALPLLQQIVDRRIQQIPQHPLIFHKKITGIDIAIVFNDPITAAPVLEGADLRVPAQIDGQDIFKKPYRGHRSAVVVPEIEQGAEKIPVILHRDRVVLYLPGFAIDLKAGDELQPVEPVSDEEIQRAEGS
jgi:hypothetical protein